ncbi:hypothetical protein [Rufibacter quisquiliarum]|uniref:hypothetical protein n=1 Tax=Rufibacter quisquiliarum TaxID=1549639 RepID=UPI0015F9961C|nr:hypothetical protein [Rufibacter quisquiliarum]
MTFSRCWRTLLFYFPFSVFGLISEKQPENRKSECLSYSVCPSSFGLISRKEAENAILSVGDARILRQFLLNRNVNSSFATFAESRVAFQTSAKLIKILC